MRTLNALCAVILLSACGGDAQPESEAVRDESPAGESVSPLAPLNAQIDQCTYTDVASIYAKPAAQWHAEQHGSDAGSLNLTVWRLTAGGPDQFNLHVQQGERIYRIDTVEGSTKVGSGTVTVTTQGNGAKFDIAGTDQDGNDLRATVSCNSLVQPVAEGG